MGEPTISYFETSLGNDQDFNRLKVRYGKDEEEEETEYDNQYLDEEEDSLEIESMATNVRIDNDIGSGHVTGNDEEYSVANSFLYSVNNSVNNSVRNLHNLFSDDNDNEEESANGASVTPLRMNSYNAYTAAHQQNVIST